MSMVMVVVIPVTVTLQLPDFGFAVNKKPILEAPAWRVTLFCD